MNRSITFLAKIRFYVIFCLFFFLQNRYLSFSEICLNVIFLLFMGIVSLLLFFSLFQIVGVFIFFCFISDNIILITFIIFQENSLFTLLFQFIPIVFNILLRNITFFTNKLFCMHKKIPITILALIHFVK